MRSRDGPARARCWQRWQQGPDPLAADDARMPPDPLAAGDDGMPPDPLAAGDDGMPPDPWGTGGAGMPAGPRRGAKDFLGAAATLAIIGAILLFLTNGLAAHCAAAPDPHTGARVCTGAAGVAAHIRGIMTLCVLVCGALAVAAFIWYMFRGDKTSRPVGEDRGGGGAGGGYR